MKAVILAAGKGTRMRELTQAVPKPMLKVQGRPILEHILCGLAGIGVRDCCIVTGWKAEVVETPVEPEVEDDTPPLPDPPEMTLTFVGFVGPPEDKIVFLRDEEAEKEYIGEKGEVIAGQFRIVEVGYEHIEMGYSDPIFAGMTERIILAEWAESEEDDSNPAKK